MRRSYENAAVIVSAVRTPIGKFGRTLKDYPAPKLGALVIREALNRARGIKENDVSEVIMGNVVSAGLGQNPARQASIFAGLPVEIGGTTENKVCGSGLKSIMLAAQAVRAGDSDCIIAGGMENMSRCPYLLKDQRWGLKFGDSKVLDSMLLDGLWEVYNDYHMGVTGEVVAKKHGVTRDEADRFALDSYRKASRAISDGSFKQEIVPVEVKLPSGLVGKFEVDECVRSDATLDGLKALKPVFKPTGILTAGNSSQLSDGAAAVVVTSEAKARSRNQEILARIVEYGQAGVKPEFVMEAPIPASKAVMRKADLTINDIDLVEHNEAYSTASIVVQRELGVPDSKFNVNGGAIALGHPIGCSGARLVATMIYSLKGRELHRGLVTLCLGGGEAVSMVLEV
ncbi:MAG: thiolase family protein [Nitrososphaerales archaeon]